MAGKSLEGSVTEGVLKRRLGSDLLLTTRDLARKDILHSIIELIANSYDADAEHVDLVYDSKSNTLSIKDDGQGMAPADLGNFYRSGDSLKKLNPITPKGRTTLGRFGIATILLSHLANGYELTTVKSGIRTTVRENFEKGLNLEDEIKFSYSKTADDETGTEIKLIGLKTNGKNLDLKMLRKRVRWELPVHLPDFEVHIDGEEVVPRKIEQATTFEVKSGGNLIGEVSGELHFLKTADENCGIHVYVNGRRIGNAVELLNSFNLRSGTVRKIVGIIHANGLEHAIGFDRSRFAEDDPAFQEFRKIVHDSLREVENYGRRIEIERMDAKRESMIERAVRETSDILSRRKIAGPLKISFDVGKRGIVGSYDPEKGEVKIPSNNPALNFPSGTRAPVYTNAIQSVVVDTIAMHRARENEDPLSAFDAERTNIWAMLHPEIQAAARSKKLNRRVLYTEKQIKDYLKMNQGEFNYVFQQEAFTARKNGRISGEEVIRFEGEAKGMVSLYRFLMESYEPTNISARLSRFDELIQKAGEDIKPVIKDLSRNPKASCFFVDSYCRTWVTKVFEELDGRRKDDPSKVLRDRLSRKLCMLSQIPEILDGMTQEKAVSVLTYAQENGIEIKYVGTGSVRMYNVRDIVEAIHHQRENYRRTGLSLDD